LLHNQTKKVKKMSKKILWIAIPLIVLILVAGWVKGVYNTMVEQDESVKTAWSQVENQYQRRLDLIPNLVNTVKGYASHERETLEGVVNARSKATQTNINPANLNEETMKQFQAAQGELSSALSRLLLVVERYPELKANENFKELQAQLEGTENRISVERKRFNEVAQGYNTNIRRFPNNILSGAFGFSPKAYFAAEAGAEKAPVVQF
jgi:LemA protein